MRKAGALVSLVAAVALLAGCYTLHHTIGNGGTGRMSVSHKQWYLLYGLIPLNDVDGGRMAGGAANYTIDTGHTFIDILITYVLANIISVQTVTVTK